MALSCCLWWPPLSSMAAVSISQCVLFCVWLRGLAEFNSCYQPQLVAFYDFWESGLQSIFYPDLSHRPLGVNVTLMCLFAVINLVTWYIPVEKAFTSQMESPHYPNSLSIESSETCSVSIGCFELGMCDNNVCFLFGTVQFAVKVRILFLHVLFHWVPGRKGSC